PELEGALREHGTQTIVTLTRFYRRVKRVQPGSALRHVIATNIKAHFPPLLRLLFTLLREKRDGDRVALEPGDIDLEAMLTRHRDSRVEREPLTADDPAVLLM